MTELKEMNAYECPKCKGSKQEVINWDAFNQLNIPVGLNEKLAIEQMKLANQAFGPCSQCDGKGFILKEKQK